MGDTADVIGVAGRFSPAQSGRVNMRLTQLASQAVAQVEPAGMEMTRAGRRFFFAPLAGITGIAPVQTIPTTTAQWTIFNNDASKSLVFETVGMAVHAGTTGVGGQALACTFRTPAQTGLATGAAIANASATSTVTSSAAIKSNITLTDPAAPKWFPIAETGSPNVGAYPGSGLLINRNVAGKIIVPPGYGMGLAVLGLAGTSPLYIPVLEWLEIESDEE